jgi:septal ring factor EnvC (AmiA/AmiB activator)
MIPRIHGIAAAVTLLLLAACTGANQLLYQPKPDDPNDGYAGSLAQAGVNTEMDFGPKQDLLLSRFMSLQEEHARLQKDFEKQRAEAAGLTGQLRSNNESLAKETAGRKQAEAQVQSLQKKGRELEARILSLSIEKSKLEQSVLLAKIADLQRSLEDSGANPVEAAAPPAEKK